MRTNITVFWAVFAFTVILALGAGSAEADPSSPAAGVQYTIVHAGTLLEDARGPTRSQVSVLIRDGRIDSVRPGFVGPEALPGVRQSSVNVVDLRDKFVMAGFVDVHVHITDNRHADLSDATLRARTLVENGATTVRDAGGDPQTIFPLRDAVGAGLLSGPRILAAGSALSPTGGHGDTRNGDIQASLRPPEPSSGVCDGVEECEKAARRQIQLGANHIKIMVTGGLSDNSYVGLDQLFTDEELNAIVRVSHLMHRKVMVHAHGAAGIKASVRANVDSVEHGTFLDDEGAKMMREHGVMLVPTLGAVKSIRVQMARPGVPAFSENTRRKIEGLPPSGTQVKVATRNGVRIATGSDNYDFPVTAETAFLVSDGGLEARQALVAATVNGAELLGLADEIGTIAPGKSADLVAFDGDPLKDIQNTQKLNFVMARGHIYRTGGVAAR